MDRAISSVGISGTFHGLQTTPRVAVGAPRSEPVARAEPPAAEERVEVSAAGRQQARTAAQEPAEAAEHAGTTAVPGQSSPPDTTVQRALQALKQRDREVRQHEQAHLLAAGPFATGGPRYTYETGPDGQRYAVGGEVPIDLSAVPGDPAATIQKAQTIQRAALAPAEPSGPDLAIAAKAATLVAQAQQELTTLQSTRAQPEAAGRPTRASAPSGEGTAALAPHVCGPNCQAHDARSSLGAPLAGPGVRAATGIRPTQAVASYQLAGRTGIA